MDPKLRPSFHDIVKHLDGILVCLKLEEIEHRDAKLSGDNDKKTIRKGKRTAENCDVVRQWEWEENHSKQSVLCLPALQNVLFRKLEEWRLTQTSIQS